MNSFHYVRLPRTLNPILRGVVIKKRVVIVETFPVEFPKCASESTPLFTRGRDHTAESASLQQRQS